MAEDSNLYARSSARLGTTLRGKYRLDRVLGIGGMAAVYSATHRNQKQFAVKMLHAELSIREDIRTRFLREGYAANSLKHSGAVGVLDDDVAEDGSAFLVMELLDGEALDALWEKSGKRFSPRLVLAIGQQLLDVLAAAHAKGIVHRDIKPANLFLTADGTLKVLDFGIARVRDVVAGNAHGTGSGLILGTPAFMAPEQAVAKASEIDAQTDVWAAGATLFTLLSGELVHEGENAPQLMISAATTVARSVAIAAPSTPASLVQIVDRALAFDKAARWPNASDMRDAIGAAYLALFGEPVSRAPLKALFEVQDHPLAPTQDVGPLVSNAPAAAVALSTSKPVANNALEARRRKRTSPAIFGAIAVGVVAGAVGLGWAYRARGARTNAGASSSMADSPAPERKPAPVAVAEAPSAPSAGSPILPSATPSAAATSRPRPPLAPPASSRPLATPTPPARPKSPDDLFNGQK